MKQVVVINISNQDVYIPELQQRVPSGVIDAEYVLPLDIALKYKQFFYPKGILDPDVQIQPKIVEKKLEIVPQTEQKIIPKEVEVKTEKIIKKVVVKPKKKPLRGKKIDLDKYNKKKLDNLKEKLNGKDSDFGSNEKIC